MSWPRRCWIISEQVAFWTDPNIESLFRWTRYTSEISFLVINIKEKISNHAHCWLQSIYIHYETSYIVNNYLALMIEYSGSCTCTSDCTAISEKIGAEAVWPWECVWENILQPAIRCSESFVTTACFYLKLGLLDHLSLKVLVRRTVDMMLRLEMWLRKKSKMGMTSGPTLLFCLTLENM